MIDNNDNLRNLTQFYGQIFIRALKVYINKEKILNAGYIVFFSEMLTFILDYQRNQYMV